MITFQFPVGLLLLLLRGLTLGEDEAKIKSDFRKKIDSAPVGTTWHIIVLFKHDPTLLPSPPYTNPNNEESHDSAYNTMLKLKKHAEESQAKVISEIKSFVAARSSKNLKMQTSWCTNGVDITPADRDLIYHLEKPEHENITRIVENEALEIDRGQKGDETLDVPKVPGDQDTPWGIRKINARAWWAKGFNGTGVIIGHIDEGVDINHPSLKYNWVGQGDGWKAPEDNTSVFPYEGKAGSHGTHTLGILIGRGQGVAGKTEESDVPFYGVGVAPGARWISCSVCKGRNRNDTATPNCLVNNIVQCLEFLYCPNPKNRCIYRPNIISVSMGCPQLPKTRCKYGGIMDPCIAALRSLGVIPVYAAGNEGREGCSTITDPADSEDVIAVGNMLEDDVLARASSKGPPLHRYSVDGYFIFKPELVAPGGNVISTVYSGPEGKFAFRFETGTSQAAPHVAGAIALLLSRTANLSFYQVKEILKLGAINNTLLRSRQPDERCGQAKDEDLLNHKFGFGRLQLPDPDSPLLKNFTVQRPTRQMPPPPKFTADSTTPSIRPEVVGVVIMASIVNSIRMEI